VDTAKGRVIDWLAEDGPPVYRALALLVRGDDVCTAANLLEDGVAAADMFTTPGYVRAYMRHRHQLPASLADGIRDLLTRRTSFGGLYDFEHTENHKVAIAATRLLTAQAFPDERIDSTLAPVAYAAALDWLRAWTESRCIYGLTEFHSPDYSMVYVLPLLNLRDLAAEPAVRRMAEMAVDYIAVEHAISHLNGIYAGGHSRAYDTYILHTRAHSAHDWSYLFYGAARLREPGALWKLFTAADSDYEPHPAIVAAALDRRRPYALRERRAETISNGVPVDVQRYTWMTDAFALSSTYGASWPDHQHRWSLKIDSPYEHSTVFTNQPGKSEKWGEWHGASEYEHLLQHEGTLLVAYHIPDGDPRPTIHGHLPGAAEEYWPEPASLSGESPPQWLFMRIGDAFVAMHPVAPFRLRPRDYPDGYEKDPGQDFYWELLSPHRTNGLVLVAARAADHPSFEAFVTTTRRTRPAVDRERIAVGYETADGTKLELLNPGPAPGAASCVRPDGTVSAEVTHTHYRAQRPRATATIDGVAPEYRDWPLIDSPFVCSEFGSGIIRVEHGGQGLELDYRTMTKRDW